MTITDICIGLLAIGLIFSAGLSLTVNSKVNELKKKIEGDDK